MSASGRREPRDRSCAYVRRRYGVPARVGMRVRWRGREGTIVRIRGTSPYVPVRFDGERRRSDLHPCEDGLEYLAPSGRVLLSWLDVCENYGHSVRKNRGAPCGACRDWGRLCLSRREKLAAAAIEVNS